MISLPDAGVYFLTLIAIAVAPGPVALVLLVRAASRQIPQAIGFGLGYALGGVIIITAVCFGLGAWLSAVPVFFEYSKYLMLAYIGWIALGVWKGGVDLDQAGPAPKGSTLRALLSGVLTCFISPYMMLLFPLMVPELLDLSHIALPDFAIVAVLTFLALLAGVALIIGFAAQISRLARTPKSMRLLNRGLATVVVCAGGAMAFT